MRVDAPMSRPVPALVDAPRLAPSENRSANEIEDAVKISIPSDTTPPPPLNEFKGLFRKEKDGSTLVVFGGITLSIKPDSTVEGIVHGPKDINLKGSGTYHNGKITMTFEKLGTYTAEMSLEHGDVHPLADGAALLRNVHAIPTPVAEPARVAPKIQPTERSPVVEPTPEIRTDEDPAPIRSQYMRQKRWVMNQYDFWK